MDKKSIIGYILIGLVLLGYFYFSRPSEEQIQAEKALAEAKKKEEIRKDSIQMAEEANRLSQIGNQGSFF